jgi:hypothetical protein
MDATRPHYCPNTPIGMMEMNMWSDP